MARNKLAGKGKSGNTEKTGRNYKAEYEKYQSKPDRIEYRQKLNKANRDKGTYGNGDGLDMSHTKGGKLVKEKASTNRARNGQGNNKRLK